MIIKLDKSLIKHCNLESNSPSNIEYFETIAEIRRRGFHYVISDRELLEKLCGLSGLSSRSREVYRKLFNNFTTEHAISYSIDFCVNVTSKKKQTRNEKVIELNIEAFSGNSFLMKNKLLLENSTDERVYEIILNYYLKNRNKTEISFDWDIRNGGGGSIHAEFKTFSSSSEAFTFCILDSDKLWPSDKLGSTATQFVSKPINSIFSDYYILPVREIENLIPKSIINNLAQSQNCFRNNKDFVLNVCNKKECDVLMFADLKEGVTKYQINSLVPEGVDYWRQNLKSIDLNLKKCKCTLKANCKHFILFPFKRKIIDEIFKFQQKFQFKIEAFVDETYHKIWDEIGRLLSQVFCKPNAFIAC